MFTHIMVGVEDIAQSKAFYDATLGVLGIGPGAMTGENQAFYMTPTGAFGITKPVNGEPACFANGGTIGFAASSTEQVDAWHESGLKAGGSTCENPPGIRDLGPAGQIYAAYLRDPIGNKLVVTHRVA